MDCDNPDDRALLSKPDKTRLAALAKGADMLLVDEAQRVPGIGMELRPSVPSAGHRGALGKPHGLRTEKIGGLGAA